ncbi:hemin-degrading factor [Myroides sp. LJL119]
MNTQTTILKQNWEELKKENPHIRIRNAAQTLGVSEMELLATQVGETVTTLSPDFKEILSQVESLGKVMALTRNDQCVHERKGVYENPDFTSPHASLFVNPDIDLRIFLSHWKYAFSVSELARGKQRKSLQFFAKDGSAVHKIYLTEQSNQEAFDKLVQDFKAMEQHPSYTMESYSENKAELPDSQINKEEFTKGWLELKDTHDFYMLLAKNRVSRTQALRLAPEGDYAKKITKESIVTMLEKSVETKTPIMVFTGNKGIIQIHTGEIYKTMWHQNWYNIMDPDFNMHLDMDKIDQVWVVRKPTEDGMVTSIEVFDDKGDIIVQFFGKRKPGVPELESWREIVASL